MPITIRIPYAGGIGGVEHHCDSSEAYYVHTPGLTVVAPATVADAYTLMREAIASPDPVVVLEPKKLYWAKDEVDLDEAQPGIGRAVVRREGTDATLIAYGTSVPIALEAADAAAAEGRSLQVVDVRTLVPFDDETVCAAVRSTGRAVVVAEAAGFASVASEIVGPGDRAVLPPPRRAGPPGHRLRHPLPAAEARAPPPAQRRPHPRRRRHLQWDDV